MKDHFVFAVECPKRGRNHLLAIGQRIGNGDCFAIGAMHSGFVIGFLNVEDEAYRDGSLCMVWQRELHCPVLHDRSPLFRPEGVSLLCVKLKYQKPSEETRIT